MSTRSTIALEYADGTVHQIYCHHDGYLSYNGIRLYQHWQDPFKVRDLMDLGSISSLGFEIGTAHPFDSPGRWGSDEDAKYRAEFGNMCKAYGRDRGDTETESSKFNNYEDYLCNHQYEEYEYILRQVDGKAVWFVGINDWGLDKVIWTTLEEALKKENLL